MKSKEASISGVLHLPLALGLALSAMFSIGFLALGNQWTHLVKVQLQLDRCAGSSAIELRNRLQGIEHTNRELILLRTASAAALAMGNAAAVEAAKATIHLLARKQDLELFRWKKVQADWWLRVDCRGKLGKSALPNISVYRPAPDPLGERPLEWRAGRPSLIGIELSRGPRRSSAFVYPAMNSGNLSWMASWRNPRASPLQ